MLSERSIGVTSYKNGTPWLDTDGNPIQAHGGYIIKYGSFYYWYGENRIGDNYVACYRSEDLINWEFRNNVLTRKSEMQPTRVKADLYLENQKGTKVNIERPKVLYNKKTNKFVMWAHFENGIDYHCAALCVATCDTPDGDFIYHGSFKPYGEDSRDCTLFLDDDGRAYFISSSRDNSDTHVYRLSSDFLNLDKYCGILWQGEYREAPAVFKRNGEYYMLNSYCTGWEPNQGKYSRSFEIADNWRDLELFGDKTTFDSQPAFVLPVEKDGNTEYIYFGDRWCYKSLELGVSNDDDTIDYYTRSTYVVLKIKFDKDQNPYIEWSDEFSI